MPRTAEAERNNLTILRAAKAVFIADAEAPIAAVAKHAGVGVSALYRRYASKEHLLQSLCADGLQQYIKVAEAALRLPAVSGLEAFITGIVEADVHSLTVHLAGTFTPTPELFELSTRATELGRAVFERSRAAGAVRADFAINDLAMIFEQMAAVRIGSTERTAELRRRYLGMHLDSLRPHDSSRPLLGGAPTDSEFAQRWMPRSRPERRSADGVR